MHETRLRAFSLSLATALLAAALPAAATQPADLCSGQPCVISGSKVVDSGSVLDFGAATELRIAAGATLTVGAGASPSQVTLRAGSILLEPGARILGAGAEVRLESSLGDIRIAANGASAARIDVSEAQAGSIALVGPGAITVQGVLDARGLGRDAQAGSIAIEAGGAVAATGDLLASASGAGSAGGSIGVSAATGVTLGGNVAATGGDFGAGDVEISTAAGNLAMGATVELSGGNPEGSGGAIALGAPLGDVSVTGTITGRGGAGGGEACGEGAAVTIEAGGDVTLSGAMSLTAGRHCLGGAVEVTAGGGVTQLASGPIEAQGPGGFGGGGEIEIAAGGDVVLRRIDLTSPGGGGEVRAQAAASLQVLDRVDVSGTGSFGFAGSTLLQACELTVAAGGRVSALGVADGDLGVNRLRASGAMTIAGIVEASGANELRHRGDAPAITGSVTPSAIIAADGTLPSCPVPPVCGNSEIEGDEACDDGNTESCDGCAADCSREDAVCGDGVKECGEACDDGNDGDGDGCDASCEPTPLAGARVPGAPRETAGCFAEWSLPAGADPEAGTSFASNRQVCTDGDVACDRDGVADGACTFEARACLRVPDPALAGCVPAAIDVVRIKSPRASGDATDAANFAALRDALAALGVTVEGGVQVVRPGAPVAGLDACTAPVSLRVPTGGATPANRKLILHARDTAGAVMPKNQLVLRCKPRVEACGDGVPQAGEECDQGPANGAPGGRCTSACSIAPSQIRIPGGSGQRALDCPFEWRADLNPDDVRADRAAVPSYVQSCRDGDPLCDLDPQPGVCRLRVWGCAGGDDQRLGCAAARANDLRVTGPSRQSTRPWELAARSALETALAALSLPAGPGESCAQPVEVDVPVAKRLRLGVKTRFGSGNQRDSDALILRCLRR